MRDRAGELNRNSRMDGRVVGERDGDDGHQRLQEVQGSKVEECWVDEMGLAQIDLLLEMFDGCCGRLAISLLEAHLPA